MTTKNLDNIRRKEFKYYVSFSYFSETFRIPGIGSTVLSINNKIKTLEDILKIKQKIQNMEISMGDEDIKNLKILGIIPLER